MSSLSGGCCETPSPPLADCARSSSRATSSTLFPSPTSSLLGSSQGAGESEALSSPFSFLAHFVFGTQTTVSVQRERREEESDFRSAFGVEKRENVVRETRGAFSFFHKVEVKKNSLVLTLSVFFD